MFAALNPGAIHVQAADLADLVSKARAHGFQGVDISAQEVADLGAERSKEVLGEIKVAGWGLPTRWRGDEADWRDDLAILPKLAQAAAAVGGDRCTTWILPFSDELDYHDNWRFHVDRLSPVADILGENGIRFGIEPVGTYTVRNGRKHEFIYTLDGGLRLASALGENVGLLLDSWHWYASGGEISDLQRLTNHDVVYVHVNDAPAGVPLEEQLDNRRLLPGESGVIDLAGFMACLSEIGYDGPVVAEPFKEGLKSLADDDARLSAVRASLRALGT